MKRPEACETMADIRAEIDRVDREPRGAVCGAGRPTSTAAPDQGTAEDARADHARVEEVVANVRREARSTGLPPDLIEKLWRRLIDWCDRARGRGLGARMGRRAMLTGREPWPR
jgi:isochorismate pyruvate lyase